MKKEMSLYIVLVVILILIGTLFISAFKRNIYATKNKVDKENILEEYIDPFHDIFLLGDAVIVMDAKSGEIIYGKNTDKQLPLASLTKIMTAIVALETLPRDSIVTIDRESIEIEGDNGLYIGEKWQLADILALTLLESSNDGARAIAKLTSSGEIYNFIRDMNIKADEIGLDQTYFISDTGLDIGQNVGGAYGSPRDMANLFIYGFKKFPEIFDKTRYSNLNLLSQNGNLHILKNTNNEIESIPGILASKTGFTDIAGGNLVILFQISLSKQYVAVVLGSTSDGRFSDIKNLIDATKEFVKNN